MSAVLSFPTENLISSAPMAPLHEAADVAFDGISIRGVRLPFAEIVDRSFFAQDRIDQLRQQLNGAAPFPHLVLKDVFNPALLELVAEEFDGLPGDYWSDVKTRYESTRRSVLGANLGPASQIYFDTINSGWFTEWLSAVTGIPYLLTDPKLFGGGLHESRNGATFAVHRDFNRHRHLGLKNEMVFITYLNKNWDPTWGSALELWDKKEDRCVTEVQPEFGHSILLPHGPTSYHGHTKPLQTPDGRPRRSVAAYFYTSPLVGKQHGDESASVFMQTHRADRVKALARWVTPPIVWSIAKKITGRV
ncbi:Proline 4-hydroxylase (Includes Rps23 Pro-64 3,4-dihydroxylase Tpa1), contains SM-20 domain [Burkholderiales bacterium 8X]|nr:Proline 4-hydroxylase (Includes Rps23 Pro-64 3,4-dihydroxylase Tpa1), contains SM-20 domain [Burkholderiales bacterium 8X]